MIIERTFDPSQLGQEWVASAANDWVQRSDVVIPSTPQEIVEALIRDRALSQWLLVEAGHDDAARLVMFFGLEGLVRSKAGAWARNRCGRREWEGRCVTAAWLALESQVGRSRPWPMWALRQRFFVELNEQPLPGGTTPIEDWLPVLPAGRSDDAAVELTRVLATAVSDEVVSAEDAQVIWLTRVAGWRGDELAEHRCCKPGSLRKRRERAERRIIERGVSGLVMAGAA